MIQSYWEIRGEISTTLAQVDRVDTTLRSRRVDSFERTQSFLQAFNDSARNEKLYQVHYSQCSSYISDHRRCSNAGWFCLMTWQSIERDETYGWLCGKTTNVAPWHFQPGAFLEFATCVCIIWHCLPLYRSRCRALQEDRLLLSANLVAVSCKVVALQVGGVHWMSVRLCWPINKHSQVFLCVRCARMHHAGIEYATVTCG